MVGGLALPLSPPFSTALSDAFFHDVDSNIITFLSDDKGFNTVDLNNINLDDDNFDKDNPETINHIRIVTWRNKFEQRKTL